MALAKEAARGKLPHLKGLLVSTADTGQLVLLLFLLTSLLTTQVSPSIDSVPPRKGTVDVGQLLLVGTTKVQLGKVSMLLYSGDS